MADRVLPRVELLFRCKEVVYDPETGCYTIIQPGSSTLQMPTGQVENAVLENMWVFAHVVDGVGEIQFHVEVRYTANLVVARSASFGHRFTVETRTLTKQMAFCLPTVPLKRPGAYRICLMAGESELENGSIDLWLLRGSVQ